MIKLCCYYIDIWWLGWIPHPQMTLSYLDGYSALILLVEQQVEGNRTFYTCWTSLAKKDPIILVLNIRRFRMGWPFRTGQSCSACYYNRSMEEYRRRSRRFLAESYERESIDPINLHYKDTMARGPWSLPHTLFGKITTPSHTEGPLCYGSMPTPGYRTRAAGL